MDRPDAREKGRPTAGGWPLWGGALAALIFLAAPTPALPAPPGEDGARPSPGVEEAYALAEGGSFERAAALADRLALLRPLDSEAQVLRAFIYRVLSGHFQRKAYREAFEESAGAALRLLAGPGDHPIPEGERELRLGVVRGMLTLQRFEDRQYLEALREGRAARERFERALALDPGLGDAYLGLGLYHYWRSRAPVVGWLVSLWEDTAEQGLRELQRAAAGRGRLRSLARLELAFALFRERRFEEARQTLAALLRARPDHLLYRVALAESYYRAKDWKESLRRFEALAGDLAGREKDQFDRFYAAFARWRLALSLWELGRKPEAARLAAEISRAPDLESRFLGRVRARAAEMAREGGLLSATGSVPPKD